MKLVVGLGNPGEKYENTRHNVGWRVIDTLLTKEVDSSELSIGRDLARVNKSTSSEILYMKPLTFMNESGKAVSEVANFYKINPDNMYVIHDDLDIKLGSYKIQYAVGPKLHGGVNSIIQNLGTDKFWRVRIGVENREDAKIPGEDYVLMNFTEDEMLRMEVCISHVMQELNSHLLSKKYD